MLPEHDISILLKRGMKSNSRPAYECLWGGETADIKRLFNVAELSRARTNRKTICRSTGMGSADRAPLGSSGLPPQLPGALDEDWNFLVAYLLSRSRAGWGGKLCCPTCERWELVIFLVPSNSLLKGMELWNRQFRELINPLLAFPQDFISGLLSASFQNPSLQHLCGLHPAAPRNVGEPRVEFFKPSVRRMRDNAENFAWCVSRQVFQKGKRQQNFIPEVSPLSKWMLSPFAVKSTIYARPASETSLEQPGEAGTSLPEVPSSGNESPSFESFFVYEIKSTRPIANCLC